MNKYFAFVLCMISTCYAIAQECPRSIEVDQAPRGDFKGWNALETASVNRLAGLKVVEGQLHPDAGENVVLKPTSDSEGSYIWAFREEIGENEAWMLCLYEGTKVRLSRRIGPKTIECRQKNAGAAIGETPTSLRAYCGSPSTGTRQ